MKVERIYEYFPGLTERQREQMAALDGLYQEWNSKINVISRKDIDQLYERHVLHSLAIARVMKFLPGAAVLDLGTGGGFPGIPLAILFPETTFTLVDGTGKKIRVVQEVVQALGLTNAEAFHLRAEDVRGKNFDFVTSRGVATLDQLLNWSRRLIKKQQRHAMPNGIIALKGGDLQEEIKALPKGEYVEVFPIRDYFREPFFEEKWVVYLQG